MKAIHIISFIIFVLTATVITFAATPSKAHAVRAPKCYDSKPSDTPRIRKIYIKPDHAILYFTAVQRHNTYYFISYGFNSGDQRFGVQFPFGASKGHWIKYSINHLAPNTTYYFQVRGGNGCRTGNWSSWAKATTPKNGHQIYKF